MDLHIDTTSRLWRNVMNRYGVGSRSDFDMSLAVREIIDRLSNAPHGIKCGNNLENQFFLPPLEYIFVNNKTIPNNHPTDEEPQKLSALTECELTFYANPENTLRMRYFIQVTHGEMIHGLSWIKENSSIRYNDTDFRPVLKEVYADFLKDYDGGQVSRPKFGIWDGSGRKIGIMHNLRVKDSNHSGLMSTESIDLIVRLMVKATEFFKNNQLQINQLIKQ